MTGRLKLKRKTKSFRAMLAVLSIGLVLVCVGAAYFVYFYRSDIPLRSTDIVIEYGSQFNPKPKDILKTNDQDVLRSVKVHQPSLRYAQDKDYPEVGNYRLRVNYIQKRKSQSKEFGLRVVDTTAPELVISEDGVSLVESSEEPDYTKLVTVKDLSEVEIVVQDESVDYQKAGDYEIQVSAVDKHGNQTTKPAKLKITKPERIAAPELGAQPTYVNGIMVVNKKHPLPVNYAPGENLTAGNAVRQIIADMQQAGFDISSSYSGYRSYSYQAQIYQQYAATQGQAAADTFSAKPGYSEHQAGLAFDIRHGNGTLVTNGPAAEWISANAHKYGFIVRYQSGKEHITGYSAEPWHLRYIGGQATAVHESGQTLEEYLGVPGGSY